MQSLLLKQAIQTLQDLKVSRLCSSAWTLIRKLSYKLYKSDF